jgi:multiple sugar transport system ATP-binding protein
MAGIRFERVFKKFGEIRVIEELNLTIRDGEFFTFVGPSGCGKSTILNLIAGLETVSEGKIFFDNKIVNELSPKDRDIAMVFQNYALYPHMTVYKNIAFPLAIKKVRRDRIDTEVKRIAALLGLEALLHRRPKELSGGQRQRVALGRALIRKPKVFLMDEPLSNLDARLRIEMRAELKRLHQELSITTVYVTHDQSEALSLSSRIAVIHRGRIRQCGRPLEVYSKPADIFVGGFIGSPPMNFIDGVAKDTHPLKIDCNGFVFSARTEKAPGSSVVIGIRPDDIIISDKKTDESIPIKVSLIEPAGSVNWIDFRWGSINLKGTANADLHLEPGQDAFIRFPAGKAVIFDKASGNRL